MLRAKSKNMLMVAASVTALVSSSTALAQQTSTTQGVLQSAPTDQAASPSAAAADQASETQTPTTPTSDAAAESEDIVVTGIRGAQRRAVNLKRDAASVTDSDLRRRHRQAARRDHLGFAPAYPWRADPPRRG
ncbi:hypothetical protein QP175_20120 [Sphingomonas aerolata]|uniref:hypothetical protein n=1 Tax=Sphingomonas aerolata TaxID=185951 RepID=UPI002FE3ED92